MRTYILYGALALGGCAAPETAFPLLVNVPSPKPSPVTADQRAADMKAIEAKGDTVREAGRMVRAGEELHAELPK